MQTDSLFAHYVLTAACVALYLGGGCASVKTAQDPQPPLSVAPPSQDPPDDEPPSSIGSWAASSATRSQRAAESMAVERLFLFQPMLYDPETELPTIPPVEEVDFVSDDETALHGWHAHHDNPRAVILYCHGNAGNLTHRAPLLRILNQYVGASVFVFDYRGYGKSEGRPSEGGLYADARAARA
jgi:hypothetical protein